MALRTYVRNSCSDDCAVGFPSLCVNLRPKEFMASSSETGDHRFGTRRFDRAYLAEMGRDVGSNAPNISIIETPPSAAIVSSVRSSANILCADSSCLTSLTFRNSNLEFCNSKDQPLQKGEVDASRLYKPRYGPLNDVSIRLILRDPIVDEQRVRDR